MFTKDMTNTAATTQCTGTRYAVNADDPIEGTDLHHTGPCPVHHGRVVARTYAGVFGRLFWTAECATCCAVLNSGHHYRTVEHAQAEADRHNLREHGRPATAQDYADIQRAAEVAAGVEPVEPW